MNIIKQLKVAYITSSRSIETYLITDNHGESAQICYIYNYEGTHFRFFEKFDDIFRHFHFNALPDIEFDTEKDLDYYLKHKDLEHSVINNIIGVLS